MDDLQKQKLAVNVGASYKMLSNWWFGVLGTVGVIWSQLSAEQTQAILAHLPLPAWMIPILGTVIGIALRLWPQKSISGAEAAAKSADTPQPKEPQ